MSETKKIDTTIIYTENGVINDLNGNYYYNRTIVDYPPPTNEEKPNTTQGLIPVITGRQDGVSFIENDLLISFKKNDLIISYEINEFGELIVNGDEAQNYTIDSLGYLIYNFI